VSKKVRKKSVRKTAGPVGPQDAAPDFFVLLTKMAERLDALEGKIDRVLRLEEGRQGAPGDVLNVISSTVHSEDVHARGHVPVHPDATNKPKGPQQPRHPVKQIQNGASSRGGDNRVLHQAVCAECRKQCEVPFKPSEGRPVYCKECYAKRKEGKHMRRNSGRKAVVHAPVQQRQVTVIPRGVGKVTISELVTSSRLRNPLPPKSGHLPAQRKRTQGRGRHQ
jgi:CxxC-x17-CxxC domain-containing protein